MLSHEIRTPLNAVLGMSEILYYKAYTPELSDILDVLDFNAKSLIKLLDNMLFVTKQEAFSNKSLRKIIVEKINAFQFFNDCSLSYKFASESKGLNFEYNYDLDFKGFDSDAVLIKQLVDNLLRKMRISPAHAIIHF